MPTDQFDKDGDMISYGDIVQYNGHKFKVQKAVSLELIGGDEISEEEVSLSKVKVIYRA